MVDLEKEEVELPPISVRTSLNSTVGDLKATISLLKNVNIDQNNIILVTEKFTNEFQILEFDSMSLQNIGFYSSNKVIILICVLKCFYRYLKYSLWYWFNRPSYYQDLHIWMNL